MSSAGTLRLSNGALVTRSSPEEDLEVGEAFHAYRQGFIRAGPTRCFLPLAYETFAEKYLSFKFRPSDVVVLTYPKCGTTWAQETVWTMLHNPDLDHPAAGRDLMERSPFLEFDTIGSFLTEQHGPRPDLVEALSSLAPHAAPAEGVHLQLAQHCPDRRVIKTHLPLSLLPRDMLDTCKVIYVTRNPRDMVASFMHHNRLLRVTDFRGTDAEFVRHFCLGNVTYGDYAGHIEEALQMKDHKNLLFVTFEEMKKEHLGAVKKINDFIGANLTEKQLLNVVSRSSFKEMKSRMNNTETGKSNPQVTGGTGSVNPEVLKKAGFFRKGEVGSWKTDFTPELVKQIDDWTEANITSKLGYDFHYTI